MKVTHSHRPSLVIYSSKCLEPTYASDNYSITARAMLPNHLITQNNNFFQLVGSALKQQLKPPIFHQVSVPI